MRVKQSEYIKKNNNIINLKKEKKKRTVHLLKTKTAVDKNSIYVCNHVMITTIQMKAHSHL